MGHFACLNRIGLVFFAALLAAPALAGQPAEKLLPASTKGFLATPSIDELRGKFKQTQLGELINDEKMKPFIEDLRKQLGQRMEKAGVKLGLKWDDLEGVYAGEAALALIQPDPADKNSHATALVVDITGKSAEAQALLEKISANLIARRALRSETSSGAVKMLTFTLPKQQHEPLADHVVYFIHQDQLVLTDSIHVATGVIGRLDGLAKDSLATLPAFAKVTERLNKADVAKSQLRWFIEPIGYTEVSRAIAGGKRKRGKDLLKILANQGFTAVQGVGGQVFFANAQEEILHRTFIYAPRVTGAAEADKYQLAGRILNFPNGPGLTPPAFVPQDACTFLTLQNTLQSSFKFSKSIVNEYAGDEVFDDMWANMKLDPSGPQIDIYAELVDLLGERVTLISDVVVPVHLKSERMIVALELRTPTGKPNVNPAEVVAKTLKKAFSKDPSARMREFQGHVIWEIINEQTVAAEPDLTVEEVDDSPKPKDKPAGDVNLVKIEDRTKEDVEEEKQGGGEKSLLPNMAFTVFQGQLLVATHVEFIEELIGKAGKAQPLSDSPEFKQVTTELNRLGAGEDSFRFFTRTDEAYRATYELIRQGLLPKAETMFARVLNNVLGEDGKVRQAEVDGSKLPEFSQIQKYLGPAGFYVHSEDDGWLLVGCLLKK